MNAAPATTPAPALPAVKPDAAALADAVRRDLADLTRMPRDAEYVTPHEILRIVLLSRVYGVDWTHGLEPTGAPGERLRPFRVLERRGIEERLVVRMVRVRREVLLQDLQGTDVPDGDVLWAMDVLGTLRATVMRAMRRNAREAS